MLTLFGNPVVAVTTPFIKLEQKAVAEERRNCRRQLSALHFSGFAVVTKAGKAVIVLDIDRNEDEDKKEEVDES